MTVAAPSLNGQAKPKPDAIAIEPADIPETLKQYARWVLWEYQWEHHKNRWAKVPVDEHGRAVDPDNWLTFNGALMAYYVTDCDGIGFVLGETDNEECFCGVDLDDCRSPDSEAITAEAQHIVDALQTYTEVSPSGTGVKAICFGKLPRGHRTKNEAGTVEIYSGGRYFAITGQRISQHDVERRQAELSDVWEKNIGIADEISPAPPGALLRDDEPSIFQAVESAVRATRNIVDANDGSRRKQTVVNRLYDERLSERAAIDAFRRYEKLRPFPSRFSDQDIVAELRRISATGRERSPSERAYTDASNAERFAIRHSQDARYVCEWKRWIVWDGKRWRADDNGTVTRLALQSVRSMKLEAAQLEKSDAGKRLFDHAVKSESARSLAATVSLARCIEPFPISCNELNADPWLLNFNNGTVDLKTGTLREHHREDFITQMIPYDYPTEAARPERWLQFLYQIFDGDPELVGFMRRLLGYALVGEQSEHVFPILYGTGANGKSTLTGVLLKALGELGITLGEGFFVCTKNQRHPTEVMDLYQKRLAVAAETAEGARLNEARIKQQTGGNSIRGHGMHQDNWEFVPSHTFLVETNYKPRITGTDEGIWRRVLLIPFTVCIPESGRDLDLPRKLAAEIPAILRWLVEGCQEWQRDGLNPPENVCAATTKYRAESDLVGEFVGECCERGADHKAMVSEIYDAYKARAERRGDFPLSAKRFDERIEGLGVEKRRFSSGQHYLGIRLNEQRAAS